METDMSDKQMTALLDRVAKLEAEVEQLKSANKCASGWEGIVGSQKDNPFFLEVIAEMDAARVAERAAVDKTSTTTVPAKRRSSRRAVATRK